jgi:hypothetical protein
MKCTTIGICSAHHENDVTQAKQRDACLSRCLSHDCWGILQPQDHPFSLSVLNRKMCHPRCSKAESGIGSSAWSERAIAREAVGPIIDRRNQRLELARQCTPNAECQSVSLLRRVIQWLGRVSEPAQPVDFWQPHSRQRPFPIRDAGTCDRQAHPAGDDRNVWIKRRIFGRRSRQHDWRVFRSVRAIARRAKRNVTVNIPADFAARGDGFVAANLAANELDFYVPIWAGMTFSCTARSHGRRETIREPVPETSWLSPFATVDWLWRPPVKMPARMRDPRWRVDFRISSRGFIVIDCLYS